MRENITVFMLHGAYALAFTLLCIEGSENRSHSSFHVVHTTMFIEKRFNSMSNNIRPVSKSSLILEEL